jgi:GNAT superfamily N-acetyltransferase
VGSARGLIRALAPAEVSGFTLRAAEDRDGQAVTELALAAADTGAVRVAPHYLHDPLATTRVLRPESEWVVAETDDGRVVGAGHVDFGDAEIEGEVFRCARLSGLMVHPDYRRRGIAGALTEWRLERAEPDQVVLAAIQSGNEGSFANARKWATQIFGKLVLPVFKVAPSHPPTGLELREPQDDAEWEQVAAGLDEYERGWNLRIPETAAQIRERLAKTPLDVPVQYQIVAVEGGQVVGGCELHEGGRLQTIVVEHLPAPMRVLNAVVRVVPKDGVVRNTAVARLWHAPGRDEVGRALWAHARSAAADAANSVSAQFDPRGPLADLIRVRPWTTKGTVAVAVRSPVRLSEERLLAPP